MRYKEYKKADIPWLEEVPSHWKISRIKNYTKVISSPLTKDICLSNGIYPIYDANKLIGYHNIINVSQPYISIIKDGAGVGRVRLLPQNSGILATMNGIIPEGININFLFRYLENFDFSNYINSTTIPHIYYTEYSKDYIPIPPKDEQEQIARFLDWKINEIDRLIEMYINKISKLNDFKDVIISNYIFNGINSNIKFKKVGLSYIDQIPENWELEKIKFNFEIVKSIAGKEGYNVLSITQQGIVIKDISKNEGQMASDYSKYQFVEIGDFAMNHMDLLTGYIDISKYFGVTSPDYRVFRIKNKYKIYDRYYLLMFQYFYKSRIFYKFGQGASHLGRWRLPSDNFLNMKIPVPSYNDQAKIVESINSKLNILNHQIERLKIIIDSLKTLKQSLISDVVTGKIDVRNVDIPDYDKVSDVEDDTILEDDFDEEE